MRHFENGTPGTLGDYDFAVKSTTRSVSQRKVISDGYVTIGRKGKTRKTNNFTLCFNGLVQRLGIKFDTVAVGKSTSKKHDSIVVFDNDQIPHHKVSHYMNKDKTSKMAIVNGSGYVKKVFDILEIDEPELPDSQVKVFFNLHEVKGKPFVFTIEPVKIIKLDGQGKESVKEIKRPLFEFE